MDYSASAHNATIPPPSLKREISQNNSVVEFLDYYADPARDLNYAVLIDGPWGVGKTYLVSRWRQKYESRGGASLYVSLYGIKSVDQIEAEIFRQLHPLLSSKGMRLASTIIQSFSKTTLSVAIPGRGATETIGTPIPQLSLTEFFKGPEGKLLVFDDLERSAMPLPEMLGYINALVEHDGLKVVLIGNQNEISISDPEYLKTKEKLIGQTLLVYPEDASAYDSFCQAVTHKEAQQSLRDFAEPVLMVHNQSETRNLRLLRQAIWDFERISRHLQRSEWGNRDGVLDLIRLVIAMSIELRSGRMQPAQLPTLVQDIVNHLMQVPDGAAVSAGRAFSARYPTISLTESGLRVDLIGRMIVEGIDSRKMFEDTVRDSPKFSGREKPPAWRRAWYGFRQEDAEYEANLAEVLANFEAREELVPGVLYHVFGILLHASNIGALAKTREEVLADGKAYVDEIVKSGRIMNSITQPPDVGSIKGFSGLGYIAAEFGEFSEFVRYYSDAAEKASTDSYSALARSVLALLETEPEEFFRSLCANHDRPSSYSYRPILASLPAREFVEKVLSLSVERQVNAFSVLKSRYDVLRPELASEESWLQEVRSLFLNNIENARPMTRFRIKGMVRDDIDPVLERFARRRQDNSAISKGEG